MKKQLTISKSGALPRSLRATGIAALLPAIALLLSIQSSHAQTLLGTSDTTTPAVSGYNSDLTGLSQGAFCVTESTSGIGVEGVAAATSGLAFGVEGTSYSSFGVGVGGAATATTGYTTGVVGLSNSTDWQRRLRFCHRYDWNELRRVWLGREFRLQCHFRN